MVLHKATIKCWHMVSSEDSFGDVSISKLTQWLLAALSSLLAVGQSPLSVPCLLGLSHVAACIIKACKMEGQYRESSSKICHNLF